MLVAQTTPTHGQRLRTHGPKSKVSYTERPKKLGTLLALLKKCIVANPRRPINPTAAAAATITALQTSFAAKLVLEDHVHASPRCLFLRPFMPSVSGAARPRISSPHPISLFGSDILLFVVNHSVIRQSYSCRSGLWPLLPGDSPHHARDFCAWQPRDFCA